MVKLDDALDCKTLSDEEAVELCGLLRGKMIETVSKNGGHLASGLGAVELTVAIHRVFDLSQDRLVFDVGHQCYSHKLLTGRVGVFHTLRSFGGISGYPKPAESPTDAFVAGHASNAVSVALGMARSRTLEEKDYHVLALLGDGAMTGGLAYEGLSNAGQSGERMIVILNDNGMSISPNVGGLGRRLAHQRLKPQYLNFKKFYRKALEATAPGRALYRFNHKVKTAVKDALLHCSMFEDMGFTYMGPVDGHNVKLLTRLLRYAKEEVSTPVLLHVRTVKGKGYPPAEAAPDKFHGVGPFDPATGTPRAVSKPGYSAAFGEVMCRLALEEPKLCAITAAMQAGTGLDRFAQAFPERFFDVGIAEGHGVTMAAGMAKQGAKPVFAVYSSFLQRGYDMLLHDVAISALPVVFGVDRAGLVGEDGETHHGVFDVAYLASVPGMTVLAPSCFQELEDMLTWAVRHGTGPIAIRYPRGTEGAFRGHYTGGETAVYLRCANGETAFCPHSADDGPADACDLTMVTYGATLDAVLEAAQILEKEGLHPEVVKLQNLTPPDWSEICSHVGATGRLLVAEECVEAGSVGQRLTSQLNLQGILVKKAALLNIGNRFVTQGTVTELRRLCGLDAENIAETARKVVKAHE